ncbi:MAG: DUF1343 domain-containing protein, partial [Verrucomicrobia bacterium]|nr:DUF1343 domain-containing protein [Verrucomicrobiota bacterium]
WFTPSFSKHQGKRCGGCQIHVQNRATYRPVATTLHILKTIRDSYPAKLELHASYFDKVMGTSTVREAFERGDATAEIVARWEPGLADFAKLRAEFLLYA